MAFWAVATSGVGRVRRLSIPSERRPTRRKVMRPPPPLASQAHPPLLRTPGPALAPSLMPPPPSPPTHHRHHRHHRHHCPTPPRLCFSHPLPSLSPISPHQQECLQDLQRPSLPPPAAAPPPPTPRLFRVFLHLEGMVAVAPRRRYRLPHHPPSPRHRALRAPPFRPSQPPTTWALAHPHTSTSTRNRSRRTSIRISTSISRTCIIRTTHHHNLNRHHHNLNRTIIRTSSLDSSSCRWRHKGSHTLRRMNCAAPPLVEGLRRW